SIVENYINRVVTGRKIGDNIFFQGGVAFNKSVVAAFENFLGKRITVPPHHDVTGAIGMALIARDLVLETGIEATKFKGFDIHKRKYSASSFECRGCSNVCEINRIQIEGEQERLFYGGRCEKYDVKRKQDNGLPDLFAFREDLLWKHHLQKSAALKGGAGGVGTLDRNNGSSRKRAGRDLPKIGIPYIFFFHEYLPFWSALLWDLGFEVVVSPKTTREVVSLGVEAVQAEGCFPVKSAHGHIKYLLDAGVKHIFTPSFIDVQNPPGDSAGSPCPYTQAIPYLARSAFSREAIISPVIALSRGERNLEREVSRSLRPFGLSVRQIRSAIRIAKTAQSEFEEGKRRRAAEVLSKIRERTIVIIGRAYNAFDGGMNLQIPQKLASLNVPSIPMDFLPLESVDISDRWGQMYWRNGERILKAARLIRDNPLLYPLFIGNFSCGPDSFILKYFADELGEKPFLHIEIDEHSADAGAITRCEAFLDSIGNKPQPSPRPSRRTSSEGDNGTDIAIRKIFIPKMSDHAYALEAALQYAGVDAEVMPP
ncbi:MAG: acyl-CoA dehydratase activase-related protein, partial [Thermodesulfovibrionales bacterium]